jgi:hypothetical protein
LPAPPSTCTQWASLGTAAHVECSAISSAESPPPVCHLSLRPHPLRLHFVCGDSRSHTLALATVEGVAAPPTQVELPGLCTWHTCSGLLSGCWLSSRDCSGHLCDLFISFQVSTAVTSPLQKEEQVSGGPSSGKMEASGWGRHSRPPFMDYLLILCNEVLCDIF